MSSSDSAPAPTGDRFAVITDDDHTGILWIVSILCLIYTLMIFLLRLEARRKNFGFDDVLAIIGTVFASVQYVLVFLANKYGLGKSYSNVVASDALTIGKYVHASQILLLLGLGFAKCSVVSLCRRLFSSHMKSHRVLCDVAMALCITWSIASILAIAISCNPLELLGYKTGFCYNLVTRWTVVGILDAITEVAIVAMAFNGLWPLQMSFHRKMQAFATFVLRLAIVVFAALHISTLRETTKAVNTGVAYTMPTVYLQVELLYALLSASVPALNRWLRNFDTSVGNAWMFHSQTYSMSNSKTGEKDGSGSRSIQLRSMDRSEKDKRISRGSMMSKNIQQRASAGITSADFVPPGPKYSVSTELFQPTEASESQHRPDSTGMNSDDMIIRKDVHWHVQYDQEGSVHRYSAS